MLLFIHVFICACVYVCARQEAEGPVAAQIQETVDDMNEVFALIRFMSGRTLVHISQSI